MTVGDSAMIAGLFGAIMGLIKIIEVMAAKNGNGKSKKESVPPDVCIPCREKVATVEFNVRELRKENETSIEILNGIKSGIDRLVTIHESQNPGRTGEFPVVPR